MFINKNKQCEVGFIQCPGHDPKIRIKVLRPGERPIEIKNKITSDLYIMVVGAKAGDVTLNTSKSDRNFAKLHPDLQSKQFHGDKLTINTSVLSARLSVSAGELHTHEASTNEYNLVRWTNPQKPGTDPKPFGKLPRTTGLSIEWDNPNGGIDIFDRVTGEKSSLPALPGTCYEITIDSDCNLPKISEYVSDFRLYYTSKLITTPDDKKFDFETKSTKRSPDICLRGFLSKTDTLGLPFATHDELNSKAENISKEIEARKSKL
jgi:hypothetical protein